MIPRYLILILNALSIVFLISADNIIDKVETVFAPNFINYKPNLTSQSYFIESPSIVYINDSTISFEWKYDNSQGYLGIPHYFDLETAKGQSSEDFSVLSRVPFDETKSISLSVYIQQFHITNLLPSTTYRLRVIPIYLNRRGFPSNLLAFTTLESPKDYWEPILPRRSAKSTFGRGFTDPSALRPHLNTGVEIFDSNTKDELLWYSESPSRETPVLPSGRRGHSLTLIDGNVYMFGGRTNGYSCSSIFIDTMDLGNEDSGREIYPCIAMQAEVHEIWKFDINFFEWTFINTTKYHNSSRIPPAREQHSSNELNGNLYIFGGKSRLHSVDSLGFPVLTNTTDKVFNDLWMLTIDRSETSSYFWDSSYVPISQIQRTLAVLNTFSNQSTNSPRNSKCIDDITVKVKLTHQCLNQIKISLFSPGPLTGSPNYFPSASGLEIVLFPANVPTNITDCVKGSHYFEFNDAYENDPVYQFSSTYNGKYKANGKLSEMLGANPFNSSWTLVVEDLHNDTLIGFLESFEITLTTRLCKESIPASYQWFNIGQNSTGTKPSPRYHAQSLTYGNFLFIFNGQDSNDNRLSDLYQYNTVSNHWTILNPIDFYFDFNRLVSSSFGASYILSNWGIFRFGGYYRQPTMGQTVYNTIGDAYDHGILLMDPITLKWKKVNLDIKDSKVTKTHHLLGQQHPSSRYLSSMVFIPASALNWRNKLDDLSLFPGNETKAFQANYQNSISDSIFVFGGFNGATSSVVDGSSSGFLNDAWLLRLNSFSTILNRSTNNNYISKSCSWRSNPSATSQGLLNCLSSIDYSYCKFRDLLLLSWCASKNQTIS